MRLFSDFGLRFSLLESLAAKGLTVPTEIQIRVLPLLLGGRSVVGVSETGSGKTLSYVLPILHLIKELDEKTPVEATGRPRAVVLVPTRELGEQVTRVFKPFTHTTRLRVRSVLGGTEMAVARRNVDGPVDVLVATPGRLGQLLARNRVNLQDVGILVFDEADQMLDAGFLPDANRIVAACPPDRQLALFSATVPHKVHELIRTLFADAEVIRSEGSHRVVSTLTTQNREVIDGKRMPLLEQVLRQPVTGGTLLFVNTREQCDKVLAEISALGQACAAYRGEMDKRERRANLKAFRDGTVPLLIATDLGSRGLDVDHVGRVINYHLPRQLDNYLHRVGRTARAGRTGLVINFVTDRDRPLIEQLDSIRAPGTQPAAIKPRRVSAPSAPKPRDPRGAPGPRRFGSRPSHGPARSAAADTRFDRPRRPSRPTGRPGRPPGRPSGRPPGRSPGRPGGRPPGR